MITVIVICDDCFAEGYPGMDRHAMSHEGWIYNGFDLCPQCHAKLILENP